MLGYTNDQQFHHQCHLVILGIQVCLLPHFGTRFVNGVIMCMSMLHCKFIGMYTKCRLALQWLSQLVCVTIRSYGVIQEFDLYRQKCSKLGCLDVVEHKSLCLVQYCIINKYL